MPLSMNEPTVLEQILDLLDIPTSPARGHLHTPDDALLEAMRDRLIDHMAKAKGFARREDLLDYGWGEQWAEQHPEKWAAYANGGLGKYLESSAGDEQP